MEDLIAQNGLTAVILLSVYYAIRAMYALLTRDRRQAKEDEKQDQEREAWIKRENVLRTEINEAHEETRQNERLYLERQLETIKHSYEAELARVEQLLEKKREYHDREMAAQRNTLEVIEQNYHRLADRYQSDQLSWETHRDTLEQQIADLRVLYERSEKDRELLHENLKETKVELTRNTATIAELRIDKAVAERANQLLEDQLDLLRGLVEPMRVWMLKEPAA